MILKNCKKSMLLFTDTYSLCYEIMNQHKEFFDVSNQPKVAGKMKDEYGGTHIYKSIELK